MKEDPEPFFWGGGDLSQTQKDLKAARQHKGKRVDNSELIEKLKKCDEWIQVYNDPDIVRIILHSYNTVRSVYEDMKVIKERESPLQQRFINYLREKGWPEEYTIQQLLEKYHLIDWIAVNLVFGRPVEKAR